LGDSWDNSVGHFPNLRAGRPRECGSAPGRGKRIFFPTVSIGPNLMGPAAYRPSPEAAGD